MPTNKFQVVSLFTQLFSKIMYSTFQAGQRYIETFPQQKKLGLFMADYRLVRLVKFAIRFMPAFACFAILWQYFFDSPDQSILANATVTALFAVSIPFQGLYLLGKRAKTPLSVPLLAWYEELRKQLLKEQPQGISLENLPDEQTVPTYQDFANLLQLAEKAWGQRYFDEL